MSTPILTRRRFLTQTGTVLAAVYAMRPGPAQSAVSYGVHPNLLGDQTVAFQKMLDRAAVTRTPIVLPPGTYAISGIKVPEFCDLRGIAGSTVLANANYNSLLIASDAKRISIRDVVLDGVKIGSTVPAGLIDFQNIPDVTLSGLEIRRSTFDAISLKNCGGEVDKCSIDESGRFALFAVDCRGLAIQNNEVENCGDGGIIVHRTSRGHDGTRIAQNRIRRVGASRGGTGQWGNGINVFRADDVTVQNNQIDDCAFSAIRVNGASNADVTNNRCISSGETAIYAEFDYRDAKITDNLIDGAANGISATNLNNGGRGAIITGNRITNINAPGPYKPSPPFFGHGILAEADALVAWNTVENVSRIGINAGWGPYLDNVTIIDNIIRNADIGIGASSVPGAGMATIKNNQIKARSGGICLHEWEQISSVDLLEKPRATARNVVVADNSHI